MTPHPDLSSSQREMRGEVAQWYESRGFSPIGARVSAEALFEPSCPIASALAALERERDEARVERDAFEAGRQQGLEEAVKAAERVRDDLYPVLSKTRYQDYEVRRYHKLSVGLAVEDIRALATAPAETEKPETGEDGR